MTARGSAGERSLGIAAVLAATLCWSFGAVLGKAADAPGVVLTFWRLWMGVAIFGTVALVARAWPSWADLRAAAPAGVLFGLNLCLFFSAINHTTVVNASIVGALTPVAMLPVAVRFLGEELTILKASCAAVAVVGVVVAVLVAEGGGGADGGGSTVLGDSLALASLAVWIVYLFATKRARATTGTIQLLTGLTMVAAVTVTPFALLGPYDLGAIDGAGWLWLALLALVPGAVGHGLVAWAQRHVDASVSSVLMQAEPVGSTLAAALLLGEAVNGRQAAALAAVVAALIALAWGSREGAEASSASASPDGFDLATAPAVAEPPAWPLPPPT